MRRLAIETAAGNRRILARRVDKHSAAHHLEPRIQNLAANGADCIVHYSVARKTGHPVDAHILGRRG